MSGLLFYLPGNAEVISPSRVRDAGLHDIVGSRFSHRGLRSGGPDGGSGMIIARTSKVQGAELPEVVYAPETQEWTAGPGDGSGAHYWIGWEKSRIPRPVDLQRDEMIEGHAVDLGDGQQWTIPIGRSAVGGTRFEKRLRLGPDGSWVSEVLPRFHELFCRAEEIQRFLFDLGEVSISDHEATELGVQLIALNYVVGRHEVSALGLLTDHSVNRVLQAFVDVPGMLVLANGLANAQKKSASCSIDDGSSSNSGVMD